MKLAHAAARMRPRVTQGSFLGGVRLGGARFVDEPAALVTLACMWAAPMPLVMWISDRFDGVAPQPSDA